MVSDIIVTLAKANLAAALAVIAILALRIPVRRWLGARTAYGLWLIVPLAVAGVLFPARRITVLMSPTSTFAAPAAAPTSAPADYSPLLFGLWLAGVALSLAVLAERQRRFRASLGKLSPQEPGVLRAEQAGGPAVLGALAPRIILPADFEARFSADERCAIMAHERGHLAAGHAQTNGLVALIQCLCWFNPLAYISARALRLDQELACDAAVLSTSAASPRLYGEALLRAQLNAPPLPLGCYWPSTGVRSLKERLLMLKKPAPTASLRLAGAGLVGLAAATAAVAAWAAQPPQITSIQKISPEGAPRVYSITATPNPDVTPEEARTTKTIPLTAAMVSQLISEAKTAPGATQNAGLGAGKGAGTGKGTGAGVGAQTFTVNTLVGAQLPAATEGKTVRRIVLTEAQTKALREPNVSAGDSATKSSWASQPTGADVARYYPEQAVKEEKTGQAVIKCGVQETGKLTDCSVVSEKPEGMNFGAAALKMSSQFTMKAPSAGGSSSVMIPIKFDLKK